MKFRQLLMKQKWKNYKIMAYKQRQRVLKKLLENNYVVINQKLLKRNHLKINFMDVLLYLPSEFKIVSRDGSTYNNSISNNFFYSLMHEKHILLTKESIVDNILLLLPYIRNKGFIDDLIYLIDLPKEDCLVKLNIWQINNL